MASIGEEKEIRALFSELKFADEQTAPSFTAVWHRAQSRSLRPQRAFNLSFAVATALLICGVADTYCCSSLISPASADLRSARIRICAGNPVVSSQFR